MSDSIDLSGYANFIEELKSRVQSSHVKAVRAANRELIMLNWDIGAAIVQKQEDSKWGDSVVDRVLRATTNRGILYCKFIVWGEL